MRRSDGWRRKARAAVLVVLAISASACGSPDPANPSAASAPTVNLDSSGPPPSASPPSATGPGPSPPPGSAGLSVAQTAAALLDPGRVEIGVWAMLDGLNLGVYRADGSQVVAGSETGPRDIWIYDSMVPALERMASEPPLSFAAFAEYLAANGATVSAPNLLIEYRATYGAAGDRYVPQLVKALGVTFDDGATITPLVEWLLVLDTFVPRNGTHAANAPISNPGVTAELAAAGNPCSIVGDGDPSNWSPDQASAMFAALLQQIHDADLMFNSIMLSQSISVVTEQTGDTVHEGHDGLGESVRFTVRASADFFPTDPICGLPGPVVFPGFRTGFVVLSGLDIVWKITPEALQHGAFHEADPSVPFGAGGPPTSNGTFTGGTSTSGSGATAVEFQAREEPSHGKGTADRLVAQVDVSFFHLDRALQLAGYPADLVASVPPLPDQILGLDVTWHSLDEHWSGSVDASSHDVFRSGATFFECTENWTLTLTFAVDSTRSITGLGTGTLDGLKNCHSNFGATFDGNATTLAFKVMGSETDTELDLQISATAINGAVHGLLNYTLYLTPATFVPPVLVVPRVGLDAASGTVVHATVDTGETATGTHAFHLTCSDCAPTP